MADSDKPFVVGLLSSEELNRLGPGFQRYFPIPEDNEEFYDLLAQLDKLTSSGKTKAE